MTLDSALSTVEETVVGKLVVLKFSEGSFTTGFGVTLQIGEENARPSTEITGRLPPAPEIPQYYQQWQSEYHSLGLRSRLSAPKAQITNIATLDSCLLAAKRLCDRSQNWLQSPDFAAIREKWLEKLVDTDNIRVILQTDDYYLQRLPWNGWDLIERFPKAELALSHPVYEQAIQPTTHTSHVAILAIVGNSQGIDTQTDKQLLEQLPNAKINFLVAPERQQLSDSLWEQNWDILFFAGHSSTQNQGETGRIYINQTDSLSLGELKYALKGAVARGLKLAIFNSCDGLGLARELGDLKIPQIIVMREPVPDRVAQTFLQYFLAAYAQGESLYLAARQARERLQALENQFPCATWLPVICQNPAEVPPTWQELRGVGDRVWEEDTDGTDGTEDKEDKGERRYLTRPTLKRLIVTSVVTSTVVIAGRFLGLMQPLELKVFDQMLSLRPDKGSDNRLLVVTIDDQDIKPQDRGRGSISDALLSKLLTTLEQYQPAAVGLDIYRDFPVEPQQQELVKQFQQNQKLIAVCKVSDVENKVEGVSPPPEIPKQRLGFSDFLEDPDGVVRRHLLFMNPDPTSPCAAPYAFNVQLAFRYLASQGISPTYTTDGNLQLGKTVFRRLQPRTGGYQGIDARGGQILLNYRARSKGAAQVTLTQFLRGQLNPEAVKNRIVLIGVTAQSAGDYWSTPYGAGPTKKISGVFIQAQMVSHIISAVLDGRPLIWAWSEEIEIAWIWLWSLLGGFLAVVWRSLPQLALALVVTSGGLYFLCFLILTHSGWVPIVPATAGLLATASVVVLTINSRIQ
ncbi:MAG: CHASE2 domain-containing protein [Nostocaceae cyanobacterium]|nr:CHASE2 domain-containing protein [Nostocaceae cyanobacterium]